MHDSSPDQVIAETDAPDNKNTGTGWLTRHLSSADNLPAIQK